MGGQAVFEPLAPSTNTFRRDCVPFTSERSSDCTCSGVSPTDGCGMGLYEVKCGVVSQSTKTLRPDISEACAFSALLPFADFLCRYFLSNQGFKEVHQVE